MDRPILLTCKNLTKPTIQALDRIEKIRQRKVEDSDSIILEGLFVLAVSSFEHSILDTIKIYLSFIPEKLDIKSENLSKDDLINGEPLAQAIENKVNAISYKNISDILNYFISLTSIESDFITDGDLDSLLEIKATRNLLIHNNLVVNNIYKETAGSKIREPDHTGRLKIDNDYLLSTLVSLKTVLENIQVKLNLKYSSFTKIKATKNLFDYLFNTPILRFEDIFKFDEKTDSIFAYDSKKVKRIKDNLSSSESLFFNIWLAHFTGSEFSLNGGAIFNLGSKRRKQLEYFISVIDILKS